MAMSEEEQEMERQLVGINMPNERELGVKARKVLSGAADWVGDIATSANNIVRNTSPVREMYGAANILQGLIAGAPKQSMARTDLPQGPTFAPSNPGIKLPDLSQQPVINQEPQRKLPTIANVNQGISNNTPVRSNMNQSFNQDLLRSPDPSIQRVMTRNADGKPFIMEAQNGGPGAPALRKPVSPFGPEFGMYGPRGSIDDKVLPGMVAAMNQGNDNYNRQLMEGYQNRNAQWAAQEGTIPMNQAAIRSSDSQVASNSSQVANNNFTLSRLQALAQAQDEYGKAETPEEQSRAQRTLQAFGQKFDTPQSSTAKILKFKDPVIGEREEVWDINSQGKYVNAMAEQQSFETPSEATKAKMLKMRGSENAQEYEAEYVKRFGRLPY